MESISVDWDQMMPQVRSWDWKSPWWVRYCR